MNQKLQNPLLDFELKCVQITDDYCCNAFEKEIRYLESLNADKLLAGFRETRGLSPKAKKYDGWENTEIKGLPITKQTTLCW